MNLVSKAVEAHLSPKGVVEIITQNLYVDAPLKGYDTVIEGEYSMITVKDQGTGIAPEDLNRIFEPFYTKKVMGRSGAGLGMAVVWRTVQSGEEAQSIGAGAYIKRPYPLQDLGHAVKTEIERV